MNGPPRLLDQDDDALKSLILRSSELDAPSARSMRRANALALGIASSTVASIGAASTGGAVAAGTMLGSVSAIKAIAVWAMVGLFSGALVSGTAVTLLDSGERPEASAPAAPAANIARSPVTARPVERANGASASEASQVTAESAPRAVAAFQDPVAAPADRPNAGKHPEAPAKSAPASPIKTATPLPAAAPVGALPPEPPSAKPVAPNDELAQELASIDQARSALRSGNAAAALEQVSRYERAYKRPRFAPEASAVRIEALIAQGRRVEAARLARVFMANHPGHPLTLRLRGFLGETP